LLWQSGEATLFIGEAWLCMWSLICVLFVTFYLVRAWARSGMTLIDFFILRVAFVYCRLLHRWSANGRNPFPKQGAAIIACNHTCSPDAAFVLAASERPISFLVAHEHFYMHPIAHTILKQLHCVPVVRTGNDPLALRRALTRLAMGELVCVFPEGNLSGVALGRSRPAKLGVAFLALSSRLPVYPVRIIGGPSNDQILSSWLLPTRRAVRVVFGRPIDLTAYYDRPRTRQVLEEVTSLIMKNIMNHER
jgi:1-acyl-sn-glycerol-3-phosphate acyltransferase